MPRALLALAALALGADAVTVDSRIPTALQPGLRQGGKPGLRLGGGALTSGLPPDGLSSLHLSRTGTGGVSSLQPLDRMGMGGGVNEPGKPRAVNSSTEEYPEADENSLMCLTNTGGTCWMQDCHPWRGATCIWNVCRCTIGTCAGADGKCYAQQNKVDQDPVSFRNVAWPDRQLAMDASSWALFSVSTVSDPGFGQAPTLTPLTEFILVRLPDGSPMLASKASPGYVLITKEDPDNDHQAHAFPAKIESRPATALAIRFTSVPWKDGAVIISSNLRRFQDDYYLAWYGNRIQLLTWGSSKDPGEMGYWLPDRPLGVELKRFEGQRCEFDCNHVTWTLMQALLFACCLAFMVMLVMFGWLLR